MTSERNWILDFDGTLLRLRANWSAIKTLVEMRLTEIGHEYDAEVSLDSNLYKGRNDFQWFDKVVREISFGEQQGLGSAPINVTLLEELRASSPPGGIAIFTANSRCTVEAAFRRAEFKDLAVAMIVGKEDVQYPKPNPQGVELILTALGWQRENTLYLGDSRNDELCAQAANLRFRKIKMSD